MQFPDRYRRRNRNGCELFAVPGFRSQAVLEPPQPHDLRPKITSRDWLRKSGRDRSIRRPHTDAYPKRHRPAQEAR